MNQCSLFLLIVHSIPLQTLPLAYFTPLCLFSCKMGGKALISRGNAVLRHLDMAMSEHGTFSLIISAIVRICHCLHGCRTFQPLCDIGRGFCSPRDAEAQ